MCQISLKSEGVENILACFWLMLNVLIHTFPPTSLLNRENFSTNTNDLHNNNLESAVIKRRMLKTYCNVTQINKMGEERRLNQLNIILM